MKRTYFAQVKLTDGRYVNLIFTSEHRRRTDGNQLDLFIKSNGKADIDSGHYTKRINRRGKRYYIVDLGDHIYPLDKKNMYEECFEDYETIDLR